MNSLMIDFETISTGHRPIIIQAGACVFDKEKLGYEAGSELLQNVSVDSCVKFGGQVDDGAFRWWLTQSEAARQSVAAPGVSLNHVLGGIAFLYEKFGCEEVWSNGSKFDTIAVEHYFIEIGTAIPWDFRAARDTRTLWSAAEAVGWPRRRPATTHVALQDSIDQAIEVQHAWHWLMKLKTRAFAGESDGA